jgi:drug/metabolite transporter (DMT)-like permease
MYLVFALLLARFGGERIDRRTLIRAGLALVALVLLTGFGSKPLDWLGVGLMLANALMFAGTVILSQYVLYEMPAPTVTLYVLTTMGVLVVMVWLAVGNVGALPQIGPALWPIIALGVSTALSRLAMFASVRALGSLRTAILAVAEIGVALLVAFFVLGDRLTPVQTFSVGLLMVSLLLIRVEDLRPRTFNPSALLVQDMAGAQFMRIAFHRAFGTAELDNEARVMSSLTTMEMQAIQRMMGVDNHPVDPFPIRPPNADETGH